MEHGNGLNGLDQRTLKELLTYNPLIGLFTRVKSLNPNNLGVAGSVGKDGYRRIELLGKKFLAHRLSFLYMTGKFPSNVVDHINHNKDDNTWNNLRDVSQTQNLENQIAARTNSKSGLLGASFMTRDQRYRSQIVINGKQVILGMFDTAEEAHSHYKEFKELYVDLCT
jgi:hypothetical protein